ncbi:MAG: hypothetical protein ABFC78_03215, partial [Methanoregula sp.]
RIVSRDYTAGNNTLSALFRLSVQAFCKTAKEVMDMEIATTNHQNVADTDAMVSGAAVTEKKNNELAWMQRHDEHEPAVQGQTGKVRSDAAGVRPVTGPAPRHVERTTALRGRGIAPVKKSRPSARSRTERDLLAYDSDVPYAAAEDANRLIVCALIERQDRVTEKLLLMINDLEYRVDDLELSARNRGKVQGEKQNEAAP